MQTAVLLVLDGHTLEAYPASRLIYSPSVLQSDNLRLRCLPKANGSSTNWIKRRAPSPH
jgi:hypothetical protein